MERLEEADAIARGEKEPPAPLGARRYVWQPHSPESTRPDTRKGGLRVNLNRYKNTSSEGFPLKRVVEPVSAAGAAAAAGDSGGTASMRSGGAPATGRSQLSALSSARTSASRRAAAAATGTAGGGSGAGDATGTGAAVLAGTARSQSSEIIREVRERKVCAPPPPPLPPPERGCRTVWQPRSRYHAQLELIAELKDLEELEAEAVALKASRAAAAAAAAQKTAPRVPPLKSGKAAVAPVRPPRPVAFMARHGTV